MPHDLCCVDVCGGLEYCSAVVNTEDVRESSAGLEKLGEGQSAIQGVVPVVDERDDQMRGVRRDGLDGLRPKVVVGGVLLRLPARYAAVDEADRD